MNKAVTHRPIAVDLFAGAGGLGLGFEQAGFDIPVAVEIDPIHAAVHQYNFPTCEMIPRSITTVTGPEIRAAAQLSAQQPIAVVIGGAPCQGFSAMGPRRWSDPRNALVQEFFRLVDELQPSYFVFENVKGLTCDRNRPVLAAIIATIAAINYHVISPWQVLNACHYGVPQSRERLFLIGAKNNLSLPSYPLPLAKTPTCADALDDLPDAELFEQLLTAGEVHATLAEPASQYAALSRCLSPQDGTTATDVSGMLAC
ncbi:MAG: DNA cytosine methyltransferase [Phormidesmis sp. RL_2_1]|nr:DNA cytosine methyltransferase [Phormidesmis sp. RL_2_1]